MVLMTINGSDNVALTLRNLQKDEVVKSSRGPITVLDVIPAGHKLALRDIAIGEDIIKYGFPIGHATGNIRAGQWVHTHNIATNLSGTLTYTYRPLTHQLRCNSDRQLTFPGFRRYNGTVGIRNEIWIIPTVSCVNHIVELIASESSVALGDITGIDGIHHFKHPYGCSQMGQDQLSTQRILADLVNHPNAGGVLVVGLGCENNHIGVMKKALGPYDANRVKFMAAQEVEDEVKAGVELVRDLVGYACRFKREICPVSQLAVGLKCGGSDGLSGVTANPLVGRFSDSLIAQGGACVLTEVPEMFGAETLLMDRSVDEGVFEKTVGLINDFKQYLLSSNQEISENPSPGNKDGGISTLEEKSLGCVQKGGSSGVVDVLRYGETVRVQGLNLLSSPGNDLVATTALAAAGCQLILFTTGRGTPLQGCVPTVKISSNSDLFSRKPNWIDFDAGRLLKGVSTEVLLSDLWSSILLVASGQTTKAENMGFREIGIFKTGVTL